MNEEVRIIVWARRCDAQQGDEKVEIKQLSEKGYPDFSLDLPPLPSNWYYEVSVIKEEDIEKITG